MTEQYLVAFGLTLIAGLATGVGGLIGIARREPGEKFLAGALGFSAGVMLYVSFVEILPEGFHNLELRYGKTLGSWAAVAAFFSGIVVIAVIDKLIPTVINLRKPQRVDGESPSRNEAMVRISFLTAIAVAIHNFPEGFATFIAGIADPKVAIPVVVAIAIHNIPEGIAVAVPLRSALGSRRKAFLWALASGLAEPVGALIGFAVLLPVIGPTSLGFSFAIIAGVMIFISVNELLPTALRTGHHYVATYGTFAGMAVMALSLVMLG